MQEVGHCTSLVGSRTAYCGLWSQISFMLDAYACVCWRLWFVTPPWIMGLLLLVLVHNGSMNLHYLYIYQLANYEKSDGQKENLCSTDGVGSYLDGATLKTHFFSLKNSPLIFVHFSFLKNSPLIFFIILNLKNSRFFPKKIAFNYF